jgi:hypothetical protein
MQSPVRRVLPFPGGAEVTLPSGPHYYSAKTWIGSVNGGVTPEQAFESLSRHATPFQSVTSVDGGIVDIPGFGPVRQHVDPDRLTIVNTTEPGHLLHPGNVFRSIVREGNDLYAVTVVTLDGETIGEPKKRHVNADMKLSNCGIVFDDSYISAEPIR